MKEFFGFGGYTREPEGYFSAAHLIFVTSLMLGCTCNLSRYAQPLAR